MLYFKNSEIVSVFNPFCENWASKRVDGNAPNTSSKIEKADRVSRPLLSIFAMLLTCSAYSSYFQDLDIRGVINGDAADFVCLPSGEWVRIVVNSNGKVISQEPVDSVPYGTAVKVAAAVVNRDGNSEVRIFENSNLNNFRIVALWSPLAWTIVGDEAFLLTYGNKDNPKKIARRAIRGNAGPDLVGPLLKNGGLSHMIAVGNYLVVSQIEFSGGYSGSVTKIDLRNSNMSHVVAQDYGQLMTVANYEGTQFIYVGRDNIIHSHDVESGETLNHGKFFPGVTLSGYSLFKDRNNRLIRLRHAVPAVGATENLFEMDVKDSFNVGGVDYVYRHSGELARIRVDKAGTIKAYEPVHHFSESDKWNNVVMFGDRGIITYTKSKRIRKFDDIAQLENSSSIGVNWSVKEIAVINDNLYILTTAGALWRKSINEPSRNTRLMDGLNSLSNLLAVGEYLVAKTDQDQIVKINPLERRLEEVARLLPNGYERVSLATKDADSVFIFDAEDHLGTINIANGDYDRIFTYYENGGRISDDGQTRVFFDRFGKRIILANVISDVVAPEQGIENLNIKQAIKIGKDNYVLLESGHLVKLSIDAEGKIQSSTAIHQYLNTDRIELMTPYNQKGFVGFTSGGSIRVFRDIAQPAEFESIGKDWVVRAMTVVGDELYLISPRGSLWRKNIDTKANERLMNAPELGPTKELVFAGDNLIALLENGTLQKIGNNFTTRAEIAGVENIVKIFKSTPDRIITLNDRNELRILRVDNDQFDGAAQPFEMGINFANTYFYRDANGTIVELEDYLRTVSNSGVFSPLGEGIAFNLDANRMYGSFARSCPLIGDDDRTRSFAPDSARIAIKLPNDFVVNLPEDMLMRLAEEGISRERIELFVHVQRNTFLGETTDHSDKTFLTSGIKLHPWLAPRAPDNFKKSYLNQTVDLGIFEPEFRFVEDEVPIGRFGKFLVSIHDNKWSPRNAKIKLVPRHVSQAFWSVGVGTKVVNHALNHDRSVAGVTMDEGKMAAVTLHLLVPYGDMERFFLVDHRRDLNRLFSLAFFKNEKYVNSHFARQLRRLLYGPEGN